MRGRPLDSTRLWGSPGRALVRAFLVEMDGIEPTRQRLQGAAATSATHPLATDFANAGRAHPLLDWPPVTHQPSVVP